MNKNDEFWNSMCVIVAIFSIAALLTKMPYFSQNMFSVYFMYENEKVDLYSLIILLILLLQKDINQHF